MKLLLPLPTPLPGTAPPQKSQHLLQCSYITYSQPGGQAYGGLTREAQGALLPTPAHGTHPQTRGHEHTHAPASMKPSPTPLPCKPHSAHVPFCRYPEGPTGTHIWIPCSSATYPISALHLCTHTPAHLLQHRSQPCMHLPSMYSHTQTLPPAPATYPSQGS